MMRRGTSGLRGVISQKLEPVDGKPEALKQVLESMLGGQTGAVTTERIVSVPRGDRNAVDPFET